jgi:alpha-ketoglutarate-dependent taurine dioxygenase
MLYEKLTAGGTSITIVDTGLDKPDGELRREVDEHLLRDGAVLLRGAGITSADAFHGVVGRFGDAILGSYRGGNTPRRAVSAGVFTSTEYPAHYEITLHNEMSYAHRWPARLYFCCLVVAETGGATPICDGRALLSDLDPEVRARFAARGLLYRQHLHGGAGLGKSWQDTFETADRAVVEEFLNAADARFEWTDDGGLRRVSQHRPAVRRHPLTGDEVWFNQADQWHPSNLPSDEAELLMSVVDEEADLPHSVLYGDGSAIPDADLNAVRRAQARNHLAPPWRQGDVPVVDNMLALHGREPFTGERRVVVSMT